MYTNCQSQGLACLIRSLEFNCNGNFVGMVIKNIRPVFVGVAFFISGCSFSAESLLPTLTGEDPAGPTSSAQKVQTPEAKISPAPTLAPTNLAQNAPANNGTDSGTFVGSKVGELRKELRRLQINVSRNNSNLQQLRANSVQSAESYQRAVAVVNSRLQVGTTPVSYTHLTLPTKA